jgi:hypothetical protein
MHGLKQRERSSLQFGKKTIKAVIPAFDGMDLQIG